MTIEELDEKFGFNESAEDLIKRRGNLHPIYDKHLPVAWIIQTIYGHVANENISLGKARELTTSAIEQHLKELKP